MKITFLSDDFPPHAFGGAGISTFELARGMQAAGHEVSVITTCRTLEEAGESSHEGLIVHTIATTYASRWRAYRSLWNPAAVREVRHLLVHMRPDVVHANNVHHYLSYASLVVAKRYAKTVIITFRDVMPFNYAKLTTARYLDQGDCRTTWIDHLQQAGKRWNPLRNLLIRWFLSRTDARVAISHALKDALAANGIRDVSVIHNGIDVDAWQSTLEDVVRFRDRHRLLGKKALLFSGRLSAAKGGEQVVRALAKITAQVPEAMLVVAGTQDWYAGEMKKIAENLGVADRLIFTGWIDGRDLRAAYASCDVVLFPSICFDAFGRVNLEAMAARKPVLGTKFGGTPEVVEDGVTGYVIDPRDVEQLAQKASELLTDSGKAHQFGEAGYRRAKGLFGLQEKAGEYVRLYRRHVRT